MAKGPQKCVWERRLGGGGGGFRRLRVTPMSPPTRAPLVNRGRRKRGDRSILGGRSAARIVAGEQRRVAGTQRRARPGERLATNAAAGVEERVAAARRPVPDRRARPRTVDEAQAATMAVFAVGGVDDAADGCDEILVPAGQHPGIDVDEVRLPPGGSDGKASHNGPP